MKQIYAVFALAVMASTSVAYADATLSDCLAMQKQVGVALQSAQPSDDVSKARNEINTARRLCTAQLYTQGVAHYSKALGLLGKSSETAVRL